MKPGTTLLFPLRFYRKLHLLFDLLFTIGKGLPTFWKTGRTPQAAYYALITLFCRTRGVSNDIFHSWISLTQPKYKLPNDEGILGTPKSQELISAVAALRRDGYYIFQRRISTATIQSLLHFGETTPCHPLGFASPDHLEVYDPFRPKATRYDFRECDVMDNQVVQQIVSDSSVLFVAQEYLNCPPILDITTMWWSTAFNNKSEAAAAQLYHFDMDRIKWLKFFFYLTDVTVNSGPTCFIRGTHLPGSQPPECLQHGYARLPDSLIRRHFTGDKLVEFSGPQGTIVAVDTRGLHKGKPLLEGHRLVFQIEYCDSLFGSEYSRPEITIPNASKISEKVKKYPKIFSKYYWVTK